MITAGFARTMARSNTWQNGQLLPVVTTMSGEELIRDRGVFFGSIFATLNHLLWGDRIWMSRFDPDRVAPPAVQAADNVRMTPDIAAWAAARTETDAAISDWADRLTGAELAGELNWYSGMAGREMRAPLENCVVHFFNHQTHHRGQVHAMLTAAGAKAPVSDLAFMPGEGH